MEFANMSNEERLKKLEEVLDEKIRPMLAMDGGGVEIIEVKESGSNIDIFVRYLGACSMCSYGGSSTLMAIEEILKKELDENIRVIPV